MKIFNIEKKKSIFINFKMFEIFLDIEYIFLFIKLYFKIFIIRYKGL